MYGSRHILIQTGKNHVGAFVARRNVESTRQTIELALQFFRCHVGSAQIFKVVESRSQCLVVVVTHIEYVDQLEEIVGSILLIEYRNIGFRCQLAHIFLEVEEYRFDGLYCILLYGGKEWTCHIPVGYDGSNLRFCHLLLVRVLALFLVDNGIIILLQIFIGKGYDILFGQFSHAVDGGYFVLPVCSVNE